MSRTLTITAAEWASVKGGTLWLVGEGSDCTEGDHCYTAHDDNAQHPPAEFVQACAFCTACDARLWDRGHNRKTDCLDCRIELVGPKWETYPVHGGAEPVVCLDHASAKATASRLSSTILPWSVRPVTLGHAYAVGQPLPICAENIGHHYFRLAHYGPPESLVGTWALQLAVTA